MQDRDEPPFLLNEASLRETVTLYHALFSDHLPQVLRTADRVCRGEFSFVGIDFMQAAAMGWNNDPVSQKPWPSRFYADMDVPFCEGNVPHEVTGDPKHVWELNRHEFLIDCGKAFYLTGESRFASHAFDLIEDWIKANPYLEGINWTGPLEVATRLLSWLWTYQFCRSASTVEPRRHFVWIVSLYQHGMYLHRHLEYYTSPNNHLVGEATALYLLGCFFPEFDESPKWRQQGWTVLESESQNQFHADGGSTEQATFYHNYCLGFFLLSVLTRMERKESVPQTMLARLEEALSFTMWMTRSDGTVPRIGDVDDARSIRFENPPPWDFRNLLSIGAVIFQREDMHWVAGGMSEDALWLLGRSGYQYHRDMTSSSPLKTAKAFVESGYHVMRSGWGPDEHHLCFDGGRLGAGLHTTEIPSSAHGHADMLSFTFSAFGKPLFVDAGFYTYNGEPSWHRYFRESQAHNTVRVDGKSQARFEPSNAWSCVATPFPLRWASEPHFEWVECAHDGFYRLKGQIVHRRVLLWNQRSRLYVLDRIEGNGLHDVEVFFHLAPSDAAVGANPLQIDIQTVAGLHAIVEMAAHESMNVEIVQERDGADGGWVATSYGCRERAPVVRFFGRVELPVSLNTFIGFSREPIKDYGIERFCTSNKTDESTKEANNYQVHFHGVTDQISFRWSPGDGKQSHAFELLANGADRVGESFADKDSVENGMVQG